MCKLPTFLPPLLNLDGEWKDILDLLYTIFCRDFKESRTFHKGLKVIFNVSIKPDGLDKEEGFWHVISKENYEKVERLIDFQRAKRLHWAKPIIESTERDEIRVWQYQEGSSDKGIRTYIWLKDYDYAIILQRKKKIFYWITAFYIQTDRKKKDLQKRYDKRI